MPIRMVKDKSANTGGNKIPNIGGGGGNPGSGCLTALLPLLLKNPKLLLLVLVLGAAYYFIAGPQQFAETTSAVFQTGGKFDEAVYDQAEVFEALADNVKNPLPAQVSLLEFCPKRLNQGQQGSCVGWSSSYAARTILYARQTGKSPNSVAFSPSSLYNQIKLPGCQGAYIQNAMETMKNKGVLPFNEFPYDETTCSIMPDNQDYNQMSAYKTKGFNRLTKSGNDYKVDMLAIKQNLAQGAPVVVGMMVGGSFMSDMMGKSTWKPSQTDYYMNGFGGHALCVIGYDDDKNGGSFEIMNSWGEEWGNKGVFFISYQDFYHFTKEAYGLYPMGNAKEAKVSQLEVDFGLVKNTDEKNIAFEQVNGNLFRTSKPIKIGDQFKIEVRNNAECYTYIFGMESDKSSYVLFPYTAKHSPYCGITGTRLFPSDYSMEADNIGSQDFMAVVISSSPLDYNALNSAINKAPGSTYQEKLNSALANKMMSGLSFKPGNTISFAGNLSPNTVAAVVMQIDKN
ncbi:MAG: peptidase C1 [Chitinophagales bacterium]|nr:peptidase C1 [Chitinophagales bacterium]